jgi:histidinol phosphatase-like PHP family hydrolase
MTGRGSLFPRPDAAALPAWRQVDYHIHTCHSECGRPEMQPGQIVRRAEQLGLRAIAFTDHLEEPRHRDYFPILRRELAAVETPMRIVFGCEVTVRPPRRLTIDAEFARQFDYVLCGYNHFHDPGMVDYFIGLSEREAKAEVLGMFTAAVESPLVHAVAHPFYVYPGSALRSDLYDTITDDEIMPIIETAARNGIAFELSPKGLHPDNAIGGRRLLGLAADAGIDFVVGTDAHALDRIGQTACLADLIEDLGLDASRFVHPGSGSGDG